MIKDAGSNKREPPGILCCHKYAKYREGGDARRSRPRKPHELRLELKIILYNKI